MAATITATPRAVPAIAAVAMAVGTILVPGVPPLITVGVLSFLVAMVLAVIAACILVAIVATLAVTAALSLIGMAITAIILSIGGTEAPAKQRSVQQR